MTRETMLILLSVTTIAIWVPAIITMGIIYLIGVLSTFIYTRIMARISQGVLKEIRDEMFNKMQTFSIKYFDTHTHGEIMSYYTNDVDTLSQMISQSLPQFIASMTSVIAVFIAMIMTSIPLTIFIIVFIITWKKILIFDLSLLYGEAFHLFSISMDHFLNNYHSLLKLLSHITNWMSSCSYRNFFLF